MPILVFAMWIVGGCENLGCFVLTEMWLQLEKAVSLPEIYFNLGRISFEACGHLQIFPHVKTV